MSPDVIDQVPELTFYYLYLSTMFYATSDDHWYLYRDSVNYPRYKLGTPGTNTCPNGYLQVGGQSPGYWYGALNSDNAGLTLVNPLPACATSGLHMPWLVLLADCASHGTDVARGLCFGEREQVWQ